MTRTGEAYERHREDMAQRSRERTARGQEIGEIPLVVDPERRDRAVASFAYFCRTYFPASFTLPWSACHERAAEKIERAVLHGGLFAFAMPRSSGKSAICQWGTLWATITGHVPYVVFVGATERASEKRLKNLKTELATNDLLLADFPEVCYPIRKLERQSRRCEGQKYQGVPTAIAWKQKQLILPTIAGSKASGAIIDVLGITGEIRGLSHTREDGRIVRPQFAIVDDPQTRESAKSPTQSADRAAVIAADIAYLAGPGAPIAVVCPCTVVYPGDMADQLLDRERHPQWQGERTPMVLSFPTHAKLWEEYAEIRNRSFQADGDGSEATEFYRQNRAAMDEGAVTYWPERFNPDELSAIQHAMNLKLRDEAAFWAECQNEPLPAAEEGIADLSADAIAGKVNKLPRGTVPLECSRLTAFVDVQGAVLFYVVCAWGDGFTGAVIDYGTFPRQDRRSFTLRDVKRTLQLAFPGSGQEACIYAGLEALTGELLGNDWPREDGSPLKVERLLVDANWQTDVVYQFCRRSGKQSIMPAHGRFIGADSEPLTKAKRKPGETIGLNWRIPVPAQRIIRHALFDGNFWKSFLYERLAVGLGDAGCLSLWGDSAEAHRMFADHLTAEFRVRTEGRGRVVDAWKVRPGRDNHWLDCLVGCAVAASMQGVSMEATGALRPPRERKRRRWSEVQGARR